MDGTAEPVSRDQILRRERGRGNINFPFSADHVRRIGNLTRLIHTPAMCVTVHMHIAKSKGRFRPLKKFEKFGVWNIFQTFQTFQLSTFHNVESWKVWKTRPCCCNPGTQSSPDYSKGKQG